MMPIFKAFMRNKDTEEHQEKSESNVGGFDVLYRGQGSVGRVSPSMAYSYYEEIPALSAAVDIVAWAFLQIPPVLRDKETNELLHKTDAHPILKLLNKPGRTNTGGLLSFDMIKSFLLCNEVYPVLVGNVKLPPVEMYMVKPYYVASQDGNDGWVERLDVSAYNKSKQFIRDVSLNPNMWTFVDKTATEQVVQLSSGRIGDSYIGDSPLNGIHRNLSLIKYGLTHNVNILENGGRPSGMFSPAQGTSLSRSLYKDFKHQISSMFSGFNNAGRIVTSPIPVDYKNFMTSNRDMDFAKLLEQSRNEVFSRYGIPLPYISEKVMTMSNFTEASTAVYDSAVIPRAKFLYKQLGDYLLPRYKEGKKYELGINETKLPALQQRLAERLKAMYETYTFTVNERRSVTGLGSIENGDTVYQPGKLFPVGEDMNTGDILGG